MRQTSPVMDQAAAAFRRPISRRSVLAGMLGLGAATFLDTSYTAPRALAAPPVGKKVGDVPLPGRLPYGITASSELSDDAFATNEITIGADDRLLPFYNPFSQTVEALVFTSDQSLHHLHRDPTQASGWAYVDFDLQGVFTSVNDVAIAANDQRVYALITGDPGPEGGDSPFWITWLDDATGWDEGSTDDGIFGDDLPDGSSPLKGGISAEGLAYFYTVSNSGTTASLQGWVTTGQDFAPLAPMTDNQSLVLTVDIAGPGPVTDFVVLYDTNTQGTEPGYALLLFDSGTLAVYPQQGEVFSTARLTDTGTDGVSQLLYAWATPGSQTGVPGYAIQANIAVTGYGEGTYFCDEASNVDKVIDTVAPGGAAASVWLSGGQYTVNLLDAGYVLQSIQQTGPGTWADPLPLTDGVPGSVTPGLVAVYSVPTDPTRNTLFAVGADGSLSVLTLDDSGWTQTQLHSDDVVGRQLDCYRLSIAVVDVNGTPVGLASAQLSTDRPVGLWQDIGSTSLVPGTPVTLQADLQGHINVSVPAEELDTAVLTVQALDPSGQPSGPAVPVSAAYDVQGFLGGTGPLNDMGTIAAGTLQDATNADGTNLFAGLDSGSAGALVTGLAAAVTAGQGLPPAAAAHQAVKLERHGTQLRVSTSSDPRAFGVPSRTEVSLSISHLFHTIGHAIRHGVDKIKSAVVRWADDVKQWVVDLETDLTDLATYAIDSIKDAFHVIGGWFATLGADIRHAVAWLKREIMGFLSSVGQNATVIKGLLEGAPPNLVSIVNGIEKQVDGWFALQETTVGAWFTELATAVGATTTGSSQPPAKNPSDTGSSKVLSELEKDFSQLANVVNDTPAKWLYDKLMQHLPQDPGPDLSGVFDQVGADLANVFVGSVSLGEDIVRAFWDVLKTLTNRQQASDASLATLLTDVSQIVQQVLQLADVIADTVLDFMKAGLNVLGAYLTYEWSMTSISPVLKLIFDSLGFDPKISLSQLVSLVAAFPYTLVQKVIGEALVIATDPAARKLAGEADKVLYKLSAIVQFIWTAADVGGDFELVAGPKATERPQQPGIIDYFDILCPIAETIFLLPGRGGDLVWDGLPTDTELWELLPPAILTALVTPVMKIAQKALPPGPLGTNPDVIPYYEDAPAEPSAFSQYYAPVVSCVFSAGNTVLGSIYDARNSTTTEAKVLSVLGTVLGDLSNVASPLTTWWLNESLEDVPLGVKLVIDGVAGVGAGAITAQSAYSS